MKNPQTPAPWNLALRRRAPVDLIHSANAGRLAPLVALKYQRMCMSPFTFLRGSAAVMAYDLSLSANSGIHSQLCGDAHVQNLGAYEGLDGRLIFDINDFDETISGPFEWDLQRMAVSLLLAGTEAGLGKSRCLRAAATFLASYRGLLVRLAALPTLAMARYQVHRLAGIAPISRVLRKAERATPARLRDRLMEAAPSGDFQFRHEPPLLHRVEGDERATVLAALPEYVESLLPARRPFYHQFTVRDVGFKVVGTGSIGLRDYLVYLEGANSNSPDDPLILQIKEEAPSVYAPYLPASAADAAPATSADSVPHPKDDDKAAPASAPNRRPDPAAHEGRRVVEGQRTMQLQSDPLLGWTTLHGQGYLVRQLNDHKAAVDLSALSGAELGEYAQVCGEMLARGHARSGNPRQIAAYLGDGKQFTAALLAFAEAYSAQTTEDWRHFTSELKRL